MCRNLKNNIEIVTEPLDKHASSGRGRRIFDCFSKRTGCRYYLSVAILLCLFFVQASAEEIGSISFEQKESFKFPEEMLSYNLQSSQGEKFDQKILDEDIKRLYSTGNFQDVVAETEKSDDGKINIILKIIPKPRIKDIIFKGNKKYSNEKLKDQVTLEKNAPLNDKELQESLKKLRDFYIDKGHNSATVSPETEDAGDGRVNLIFNINEELRKKVLSVDFTGNTFYSSWNLRTKIATQHSYFSWLFNIGLLDSNELELDKDRLRDLYWNDGYLDFKVTKIELNEDPADPEYVAVVFDLDEGEPYKIQEVSITGNQYFTADDLEPDFKLKTDSLFDNRVERADMDTIAARYHQIGYCDFNCQAVRVPDFSTHTVNIEYKINEGRQFTVRDLNIAGNYNTKDYVIRREMAIQPGDYVDSTRIETSKSRLMGMNYFENVEIVSVGTENLDKKDLTVSVKEKDTAKFAIGGGMSDTDSLVGSIEISQINFDLFDPWNYFVGGGQRLSLQAQYGIEHTDFSINFTEPWLCGIPLSLDVSGFYHDRAYEYWNERRMGGDIFLTKRFWGDFNRITLGYTFQQVRVHKMDKDLSEIFQKEKGTEYESKISAELARDTRNSLMEPTSGYLLSLFGELNPRFLGGSKDYYKLEAKACNYYPFLNDLFVWQIGAKMGEIHRLTGSGRAPIYERYFLGGGDTIRGFPYRKVSPKDDDNKAYGGQSMLLMSTEITHPIYKFIRGAVFCDAGNAWDKAWDMRLNGINVGVGYGLRIKVPYINAPIKLDLAYPIVIGHDEHISRKFRFHFNVGFTWSP